MVIEVVFTTFADEDIPICDIGILEFIRVTLVVASKEPLLVKESQAPGAVDDEDNVEASSSGRLFSRSHNCESLGPSKESVESLNFNLLLGVGPGPGIPLPPPPTPLDILPDPDEPTTEKEVDTVQVGLTEDELVAMVVLPSLSKAKKRESKEREKKTEERKNRKRDR